MLERFGLQKFNSLKALKNILKHSIFVTWILYTSVYVSLILYYWFYTWYIPKAIFKSNVMFELKNLDPINKQYELVGAAELYNENGPALQMGQEYKFMLELEVPESDKNFEIGIFGVSADLYDIDEKITTSFRTTVCIFKTFNFCFSVIFIF